MTVNAQPAHNPNLFNTRSVLRPLSNKETMQRTKAVCASQPSPNALSCSGQIFLGMFFDGTGNNETKDYLDVIGKPADQKHSNVVRLYHAYPNKIAKGTTKYYSEYIPGVGTPFPEIGDEGGAIGTAAAWNGEPRLIWGITRVFNAVSEYVGSGKILPDGQAGTIANATGGLGSLAMHRNHVFKSYWADKLKQMVRSIPKDRPKPEQINLSVYGFSRGAAEARTFVNWLYAICDGQDGAYTFAGIPLRVQFLGIFDTVASVGIAGAFTNGELGAEGRQSWAADTMQVHPGVESCLHIVAGHEVRSTFPLDSVRIEGIYPPNVKEYVYPGAHSDVGGGYHPTAHGKTDLLARIPCFEMYCAALAAGVPFTPFKDLRSAVAQALTPTQKAVDVFNGYMKHANIQSAPVEDMMRQHMAQYFRYRYQARNDPVNNPNGVSYIMRDFFQRASEKEFLRDTQQHFIAILAMTGANLKDIMKSDSNFDGPLPHPFQKGWLRGVAAISPAVALVMAGSPRVAVLRDNSDNGDMDRAANKVYELLKPWRTWLEDHYSADLVDADAPERDVLSVIETLTDVPLAKPVVDLFDNWIHDSMAGLAKDKVNEFLINGIGLAKFRRVYFGNEGDKILRTGLTEQNNQRKRVASQRRAQREQWDRESREYGRTRSR